MISEGSIARLSSVSSSLDGIWPAVSSAMSNMVFWLFERERRDKEAQIPFSRVVFVHARSRKPMHMTRKKRARLRKRWNKMRRAALWRAGGSSK